MAERESVRDVARAIVLGFGRSGEAAARMLRDRGAAVWAVDDRIDDAMAEAARMMDVELTSHLDGVAFESFLSEADLMVVSPGVAPSHDGFRVAQRYGTPIVSELELAAGFVNRPMVAVTGTNGKTSVTSLITAMLKASGVGAVAVGNIGWPLSAAVNSGADVLVVEVSSFQLAFTRHFRPAVAVWLNAAPDHLDWHGDLASYLAAKARIWAEQGPNDIAVVNAEDPVVMEAAAAARSRIVTFSASDFQGASGPSSKPGFDNEGQFSHRHGVLWSGQQRLLASSELVRYLPHDVANALAASAAALSAGASVEGVRQALVEFDSFSHRVSLVADVGGVHWYDDSKATNPHAAAASVGSFQSVVLLAGGRNKGLDLQPLGHLADRIRYVVALGEAAEEIRSVFAGQRPVEVAESMEDAVRLAASVARPGDSVILAPACSSFDWYESYAARGDDFTRCVLRHLRSDDQLGVLHG